MILRKRERDNFTSILLDGDKEGESKEGIIVGTRADFQGPKEGAKEGLSIEGEASTTAATVTAVAMCYQRCRR